MSFDYRRDYEHQLARGEQLQAALGTPLTVVTLTGAMRGTMPSGLNAGVASADVVLCWCAGTAAAIILVRAVYHRARSLHGHAYRAVEAAAALREHHRRLRAWHAKHGNGVASGDQEFEEYLDGAYARAATTNQRINDYRTDQLFLGQRWMIRAAIATAVAGVAYLANQAIRMSPPERVLIVTPSELNRSTSEMADKPKSSLPPKPTPPPLREIRQGHVPPPPPPPPAR